jgi:poly-beta-1,6-N-acetyl-D-glucosamine synthase
MILESWNGNGAFKGSCLDDGKEIWSISCASVTLMWNRRATRRKKGMAMKVIFDFVFLYPFLMAFVWIFGSIIFRLFIKNFLPSIPVIVGTPPVSILVPCHNEEFCVEETISRLERQNYPQFEIIAVDDASNDRTPQILRKLQAQFRNLRVITLKKNQGKGTGLTLAALCSRSEYLMCIDADAILDPNAIRWMMWHFQSSPRVGAVTGNPKVRNRTSILSKIQVGEFSSIIGMIKRAQRVLGRIYTVSGVVVLFRKRALMDVGFWSNNMVTEDIDISWKLQLDSWEIRYEPRALCWILAPETLKGLFRQRLRWAQGGNEVLLKYSRHIFNPTHRRMFALYLEYCVSVIWCYCFLLTAVLWAAGFVFDIPPEYRVRSMVPGFTGVIIAIVSLIQLCVGLSFDSKYDRTVLKLIPWLIWYPFIYWVVNCIVTIIAFPKALFKKKSALAVWESPDRGLGDVSPGTTV